VAAVTDGNKKRYLVSTDQVRRMPVGIVVVVDQAYMEDVLLAFANSPLRFQITQVEWKRFTGTLAGAGSSGSAGGSAGDIDFGFGLNNVKGSADPDAAPGSGSRRPGRPGRPGGPGPVSPGPTGHGPGPVGFGQPAASSGSTVSESQITSALVELSIYGVISLYEKYDPNRTSETAAPASPTPSPTPTPAPTGPKPATIIPGAKKQKRRRERPIR
jgi:hypothetical protein